MNTSKRSYSEILLVTALMFFIFGFLTWVNGTLVAFFKKTFELSHVNAYLVTFAYYLSYTVMAIPSSIVLEKAGLKKGMIIGLLIMALGCVIFIPASVIVSYPVFLMGLFTTGIGLTLLQTAVNPFVTLMGPHESAAKRISFMGFSNKTGGICGQIILGSILLHGNAVIAVETEMRKIIIPYLLLALFFIFLSAVMKRKNWYDKIDKGENAASGNNPVENTKKKSVFQFPNLVLGVIALFCASAAEVIAVDTIISYGLSLGLPEAKVKLYGSYTLGVMIVGYISGMALIPKYIKQENYLKYSAMAGTILTLLAIYNKGTISVFFIVTLGFVNALLWPTIWPLSLNGLGKFTERASALLIMSVCAGAIVPLLYGLLADTIGSQKAYWIIIPCYIYIAYYASSGYKKRDWRKYSV